MALVGGLNPRKKRMDDSIRLGRILGIKVGMNWSLLIVFWLISWSLAGAQLPSEHPGYGIIEYWTAGVTTAFVFFVSLLAHEMAHALMARRDRVEVEGITLWLFGGVARIRGDAASSRSEMRITIVGPLTSLAIAGVFVAAGAWVDTAGGPEILAGVLRWLGRINAMLAVFNMLPAFPLDGGRVLRAWLWRTRDKLSATRIAARVGQGFGYLLIGAGIFQVLSATRLGGVWLVFLGWFVMSAAKAERAHVTLRATLANVGVDQVMTPAPVAAPEWLSIESFIDQFPLRHGFSSFPLVEVDGHPTGLVVVARLQDVPPAERARRRITEIAVPIDHVAVGRPDEPLTSLLDRMPTDSGGRALVVDEHGRLAGIVTPADVERALTAARLGSSPVGASPPTRQPELPHSQP